VQQPPERVQGRRRAHDTQRHHSDEQHRPHRDPPRPGGHLAQRQTRVRPLQRRGIGASAETLACLSAFDWPGNVRQLENAVYRAIVLSDAPYLQPHDFPAISGLAPPMAAEPPPKARPMPIPSAGELMADIQAEAPVRVLDDSGHLRKLEEVERDLIQLAIEVYSGHMSEVARRLGIGRSTLYRKVREQGLDVALDEAV